MEASTEGDTATITFTWETQGGGDLLTMALPHHLDVLTGGVTTDHVYNTIKGDMVGIVGNQWTLTEDLTTMEFFSPSGIDSDKVAAIQAALEEDLDEGVRKCNFHI